MLNGINLGNIKLPKDLKIGKKIGETIDEGTRKYKRGCITMMPIVALIIATVIYLIITNIKWILLGIIVWVIIIYAQKLFHIFTDWMEKESGKK